MAISYQQELLRKSIHLSSIWVSICYFFLSSHTMLIIVGLVTILMLTIDLLKLNNQKFADAFNNIFAHILRPNEQNNFTSASYMMVAILLTIALFSKIEAISAITILVISDSAAALFGKLYGGRKILGKTLAGTLAFLISGLVVNIVICWIFHLTTINLLQMTLALVAATIMEFISNKLPIDDNFTIPLIFAGILYLVSDI